MTSVGASAPIDPQVLEQAADWLMQLHAGDASVQQRRDCERWRLSSPEHARAWGRAEKLLGKLGGLPPELAMPALDRSRSPARRAAMLKLAALLATVPGAWLLLDHSNWRSDYHTATGERREIVLADGSHVSLNTGTTLDVRFDAQRRLLLRGGEIAVRTAPDAQGRPFVVQTAQGQLEALGTVFSVREEEHRTQLAVQESRVRITPQAGAAPRIVDAGQQVVFTQSAIGQPQMLDAAALAWRRGMLLADDVRLADFAQELARYRPGVIHCDPQVAHVRISGAFPIADTDAALVMLVSTYPVLARTRLGGYWVTLAPPEK